MPGTVPVRAILPVPADGAVDEVGLAAAERRVAQAKANHDPGPESLDDAVGALQQAQEDVSSRFLLEVQGDRPFATVEGPVHGRVLAHHGGHPAHVVAAGLVLDLDHLGAEVGQDPGGEVAGKEAGEVEDADTV